MTIEPAATEELTRRAATVGDLHWYRQGGPPLSAGQTCALYAGAGLTVINDVLARLTRRFRSEPAFVDLDEALQQSGAAARAAHAWARDELPNDVFHHSERTLLFSVVEWVLSGGRDGPWGELNLDALCVAARFHDATLHHAAVPGHGCFTVGSADLAARFAAEQGLSKQAIDEVVVAITSNPSPRLSVATHGTVAVVLSAGGLDEMLSRMYRLHPDNDAAIAAAHPWGDFTQKVSDHMARQRRSYPGSRFAYTGPLLRVIIGLSARSRR